jgi:hypothetical protein
MRPVNILTLNLELTLVLVEEHKPVQPPKFDALTSCTMFRLQFETVAEHNWTPCDKATYLIMALYELVSHILPGIPTRAMYEWVSTALE